ncbi:MAG: hypothetical protein KF784_04560 [Fimbriimonadaceae bacterium]|nr:hypothetical protein [Fimbriimonadaceae bacterium]
MHTSRRAFVILAAVLGASSYADDGYIAYGGTAQLMNVEHSTVQMVRETVKIYCGPKYVDVKVTFTFKNHGEACRVPMGFPDYGMEKYYNVEHPESVAARSAFQWFKTWVDGEEVEAFLMRDKKDVDLTWHVKHVEFKKGQTRTVVVRYQYTPSIFAISPHMFKLTEHQSDYVYRLDYTLHTGASWRGKIEGCDVMVTFASSHLKHGVNLKPWPKLKEGAEINFTRYGKGAMLYNTRQKPAWDGKVLRWTLTNFEPDTKDDISLHYGLHITDWSKE